MTYEAEERKRTVEDALEADREKGLRDVFAASALGAIIASSGGNEWCTREIRMRHARSAYAYADAMMKARQS